MKWRNWTEGNWHARKEMSELTGMNWNESIEVKELTWVNYRWLNCNERIETNQLNWINEMRIETNELTWMNWNDWIETNELKRINWNEWLEISDLKWMNWKEWIAKGAPNLSVFCDFYVKSSSRYNLVHILSTTFPDRGAHPRKQRSASGDHGQPLKPEKTQGIAPESLFSREFTRSRSPTLRNYFMMMWLTWWCGRHDDWDDDVVAMMVR